MKIALGIFLLLHGGAPRRLCQSGDPAVSVAQPKTELAGDCVIKGLLYLVLTTGSSWAILRTVID